MKPKSVVVASSVDDAILCRGTVKTSCNDVRWQQLRSIRTGRRLGSDASFGPNKRLVPFEAHDGGYIDPSKLWTAFAFTCGVSWGGSKVTSPPGCPTQGGLVDSSNTSNPSRRLIFQFGVSSFAVVSIWEYEKIRAQAAKVIRTTKNLNKWLKSKIQGTKEEASELTKRIEALWMQLTPGERIFAPICALNLAVFGLWRIPSLQPFMIKYFTSNPAASE